MNWNHIIIEGYCARLWDYHSKHSKWVWGWEGNENPEHRGKYPNPNYDPNVKIPRAPKNCKKEICIECVKCKYLAYCDVDDELHKRFNKLFHEYCEEEDDT